MIKDITAEQAGLIFGLGLVALAGVLAYKMPAFDFPVETTKVKRKTFDMSKVWADRKWEKNNWVWHLYYEDSEYQYETSEESYSAALDSLRKLVLA